MCSIASGAASRGHLEFLRFLRENVAGLDVFSIVFGAASTASIPTLEYARTELGVHHVDSAEYYLTWRLLDLARSKSKANVARYLQNLSESEFDLDEVVEMVVRE